MTGKLGPGVELRDGNRWTLTATLSLFVILPLIWIWAGPQ